MRNESKPLLLPALCLLACLVACRNAPEVAQSETPPEEASREPAVAFVGVTVLPLDGERELEEQTVVVRGERIEALGPTGATPVPPEATRIDARGKFLMPGLVDMHLHLVPGDGSGMDPAGQQLALLLANGITTARALVAPPSALLLRERVTRGEVVGPRLLVAAPSLHGKSVQGPELARQRVREAKAAGYDGLKTHGSLGRDTYDAMVDEARAQGLRLSGHVTPDVGLARALEAGQQVEHLDGYLAALLPPGDPAAAEFGQVDFGPALARMDPARIPALAEATRKAGVWNSPTLALFDIVASIDAAPRLRALPEMRYAPPAALEKWTRELTTGELAREPAEGKRRFVELRRAVLRGLHAAGARLLVGSDSPQLFMVSGFALHQEMEAMAEAGLPPLTILQAATRNPAEYLGEATEWGSVAPGQRADLLLLDANPLRDVKHTRAIAGVMTRGRWLPRAELDAKLEAVATAVQAPPAPKAP
jgi:cytosine/adenosine deaminase-related metal-dependent hydrolase